jgi:hypothetical protein
LIVQIAAVEPAVDLGELVLHVADFEIAPETIVVVVLDAHIELA